MAPARRRLPLATCTASGTWSTSRCILPPCALTHHSLVHTHTHTHPFNGPFSGTTWVSRYQKGKTNLDFTEARDGE